MSNRNTFHSFLREIRRDEGLTQASLASTVGCSERTIRRAEQGRSVSRATRQKIVNALNQNSTRKQHYDYDDVFPDLREYAKLQDQALSHWLVEAAVFIVKFGVGSMVAGFLGKIGADLYDSLKRKWQDARKRDEVDYVVIYMRNAFDSPVDLVLYIKPSVLSQFEPLYLPDLQKQFKQLIGDSPIRFVSFILEGQPLKWEVVSFILRDGNRVKLKETQFPIAEPFPWWPFWAFRGWPDKSPYDEAVIYFDSEKQRFTHGHWRKNVDDK